MNKIMHPISKNFSSNNLSRQFKSTFNLMHLFLVFNPNRFFRFGWILDDFYQIGLKNLQKWTKFKNCNAKKGNAKKSKYIQINPFGQKTEFCLIKVLVKKRKTRTLKTSTKQSGFVFGITNKIRKEKIKQTLALLYCWWFY